MKKHDVLVIGGGPGGSTLGSLLARKSIDVGIIERESYPRFHIGESLLPGSMPLFKEIGFYETLDSGKYIRKYGARFVDHQSADEIYFGFDDGFNRDIPMAFEVQRADFDADLLMHARKLGATVYQPERVREVRFYDSYVSVKTNLEEYETKYLIDASGRDSYLGKHFKLRDVHSDLNNVAVFAHFVNVKRQEGRREGDITIGLLPQQVWSWVIPFKGDRTSVGVVCNSSIFKMGKDLSEYLDESMQKSPHLQEMMNGAERVTEMTMIANYSHGCKSYFGDRWLLVGDAAVFLDPIFSSGVHVAVTSAKFASEKIASALQGGRLFSEPGLGDKYQEDLNRGVKRFHSLISLFYRDNFVQGMKKTLHLEKTRQAFTSAVAGDMWNEENFVLQMEVL